MPPFRHFFACVNSLLISHLLPKLSKSFLHRVPYEENNLENPLDSVWIIAEDAETVEAKASYTENGKKDVSVLTYKNKDLQMFLSLGADWPELYIKEDYALPNYRNLKEIETIAMEYYTSDFEAVRMVIKDRDEIKTIQADMLRATEKESWKKEAITKDMIVEEWDVYIKYSGVGAEYHYGTLVPLEEEKTFGISKLMLDVKLPSASNISSVSSNVSARS